MKKIIIALVIIAMLFSVTAVSATDVTDDTNNSVTDLGIFTEENSLNDTSNYLSINNNQDNNLGATSREQVNLAANDTTMYYKNGSSIVAVLTDSAGTPIENQTIHINVNGGVYNLITNVEGKVSMPIGLSPNVYNVLFTYDGTDVYENASTNITLTVKSVISGSDIELYYRNGTAYEATFLDGQGNPLAYTTVTMNVNGVFYYVETNEKGVASLPIGLNAGNYTITSTHPNGLMYSNQIVVKPVISGSDIELYYRNGTAYEATFLDGQGNPLAYTTVTMNVNGVFYGVKTDEDGVASLPIGLNPTTYIITCIHPDNGYLYSNTITVKSTLIVEDIYLGYREGTYCVTALDGQGNLLKDANIEFNINGVLYDVVTDENGVASIPIGLLPNTYIVTATHSNGLKASSNLYVLSNLNTYFICQDNKNFTQSLVEYLTFTLYNELGHVLSEKEVTIGINKDTYILTTDELGNVYLPIDFVQGVYQGQIIFDQEQNFYQGTSLDFTVVVNEPIPVNITVLNNESLISGDYIEALFTDVNGTPLANISTEVHVNGTSFYQNTDKNGIARMQVVLDAKDYLVTWNSIEPGYSQDPNYSLIYVYETNVTSFELITPLVVRGEYLRVLLKAGSTSLANRTVTININGVPYDVQTNALGIASLRIGLMNNKYTVYLTFDGDEFFEPAYSTVEMEVCSPINSTITTVGDHEFYTGKVGYYTVFLADADGNPIANQTVTFNIVDYNSTNITTGQDGIASLPIINLPAGSYSIIYSFEGNSGYASAIDYAGFTVKESNSSLMAGYYVQKQNFNKIDFSDLANNGVNVIFLGSSSIAEYGSAKVEEFIEKAHTYGIQVHVWNSVYNDGSFISPVNSDESINYDFIATKTEQIVEFMDLGFDGVHLDYCRFPGTAYKHPNGQDAITACVLSITTAVKKINSNLIVSMSLMPEMEANAKYYGQNITELSKIVDVVVPMAYKGNYQSDSEWIGVVTKWYQSNSQGAEVWTAITTYDSDSNVVKLSVEELLEDSQAAVDGGAYGVLLFRYGLSYDFDFNDIDVSSIVPKKDVPIAFNDILSTASELKIYIEENGLLPSYVTVGDVDVTLPQFLYLMSEAISQLGVSTDDIMLRSVNDCQANVGEEIYDYLNSTEFIDVAKRVANYSINNGVAPNYASTSIGSIKYSSLVYAFSRILAYYDENGIIPAIVYVDNYLDNPIITVNMKPSSHMESEGYKYINYTTSWLNYCPDCHCYGCLLINPKGVYEGELTCAFCDADFCGVTGWDKYPRDVQLTRKSESVPTETDPVSDTVSLAGILDAAVRMKGYIETNNQLPNYITIDNAQYSCAVALYLFNKAIVNINNGDYSNISIVEAEEASNPSGTITAQTLSKTEYLDVCNRVANFIANNQVAPNYASCSYGTISYTALVDMSSRILAYYYNNDYTLPSTVEIKSQGGSTSKSIQELSDSLCSGLNTTKAKAVALYNYVRDHISYSFYYNTVKGAAGTLSSGSGNCCDQAQLLIAMFRAEGLTCRFVHGTCTFSSGSVYGHVWTQVYVDGAWVTCDPTSTRNSYGVVNNWNTKTATIHGYYDTLPF